MLIFHLHQELFANLDAESCRSSRISLLGTWEMCRVPVHGSPYGAAGMLLVDGTESSAENGLEPKWRKVCFEVS